MAREKKVEQGRVELPPSFLRTSLYQLSYCPKRFCVTIPESVPFAPPRRQPIEHPFGNSIDHAAVQPEPQQKPAAPRQWHVIPGNRQALERVVLFELAHAPPAPDAVVEQRHAFFRATLDRLGDQRVG